MTIDAATSRRNRFKIIKRQSANPWIDILAVMLALVGGLLVGGLIIEITTDANVIDAYSALYNGAFGSSKALQKTLLQATPLLFTGLATIVAFRGRIWNIGGEGQFLAGAMVTAWISMNFSQLPQLILIPLVIIGAMVGGALWAAIAGFLRARYNANEIIVTVMLNYVIHFILSYLLGGPWKDPDSFYLQTFSFAESTFFPFIGDSKIHMGSILAVFLAMAIYILLWKTPLGYEIRAIGVNPVSSEYKGVQVSRTILLTMLISGAMAGLGGGTEIAANHHRLRLDISTGYGFTGILVAMMGQLNPFGAILSAIFFGAMVNGSYFMQIKSKVPFSLVETVQGVILFFLVIAFVLRQYRIKKVGSDE
jgi:simple sugar transport system permease protein